MSKMCDLKHFSSLMHVSDKVLRIEVGLNQCVIIRTHLNAISGVDINAKVFLGVSSVFVTS